MNINDSVTSPDGALKVTLTAFDPRPPGPVEDRGTASGTRAILCDGGIWRSRTDEDRLQNLRPEESLGVSLRNQPE